MPASSDYTGQPNPGATIPLPVSPPKPPRTLDQIKHDWSRREALAAAIRDTLQLFLSDHPALEHRTVEVADLAGRDDASTVIVMLDGQRFEARLWMRR